jgi:lysozyme family protein
MADFDIALAITLPLEGEQFTDDPDDPGGATKWGITLDEFSRSSQRLLGIDPTVENLEVLTAAQAGIIYRNDYWNPIKGDSFEFQPLANIVFDFYVNGGTHATTLLQNVINTMNPSAALVVDGSIGQGTLNALASLPQSDVYNQFKQGRIGYYQDLATRKPVLGKFLKGWLNRCNTFADLPPSS